MWRPPATAACCSGRCARSCGRARLSTCLTTRATCASGMPLAWATDPCWLALPHVIRLHCGHSGQPCPACSLHILQSRMLSASCGQTCWPAGAPVPLKAITAIGTSWARCLARGALGLCARQQSGRQGGATHAKPSQRCPSVPVLLPASSISWSAFNGLVFACYQAVGSVVPAYSW